MAKSKRTSTPTKQELMAQLGARIKKRRESSRISQTKLAEDSSMLQGALSEVESGRRAVPIDRLYRLAKSLHVKASDILGF